MKDKPRKLGRRKKDPADKRSEVLYLKLTPSEKELVNAAWDEPSVAVRELAVRAARREMR